MKNRKRKKEREKYGINQKRTKRKIPQEPS